MNLRPVILCGGSGTRLWPESRASLPKQFIPLTSKKSLFELTLIRLKSFKKILKPIILTSYKYEFHVKKALYSIGIKASIILETKPIGTTAAMYISAKLSNPNDFLLVMPSDHLIGPDNKFCEIIEETIKNKIFNKWIIFGVEPNMPSTGYGYLQTKNKINTKEKLNKVISFKEKPNKEKAQKYIDEGYHWNSGIFLCNATQIEKSIKKFAPQTSLICESLLNKNDKRIILNQSISSKLNPISIDYSVLEKEKNILCRILDCKWTDVGSWDSVSTLKGTKPDSKNIIQLNSSGNFIRNKKRIIATIGIEDSIIVDTDDATLIVKKTFAEKVKDLVEVLKDKNINEAFENNFELRPWGKFENLLETKFYKIKKITVDPLQRLSLQYHNFRSEHWVVISGTADVYLDGKKFKLKKGESIDIPTKSKHYLKNPLKKSLIIIETQLGSYFGEDDIVRLDDPYDR